MPLTSADVAKQKQEAERQAIERLKAAMTAKLDEMKQASPSQAESIQNALKAQCTDTRLSPEFKNFVMKRARHFECESNMRAATKAMNEAVDYAHAEKMAERSARLAMGRQWFSKACSLGANDEFRRATERLIETAMMTGGIYKPGVATRAKPVDNAPKNPNDAKAMPVPEKEEGKAATADGEKAAKSDGDRAAKSNGDKVAGPDGDKPAKSNADKVAGAEVKRPANTNGAKPPESTPRKSGAWTSSKW